MGLLEEINESAKKIHTDGYPMSIGEIAGLYKDDELDIHPEFQRIFRWTLPQKSKLIESILLGIPLPSIFVSQREDGVWDVVDGVQRLSTIFEFMGILKDEDGNLYPPKPLEGTKYLSSLKGKLWETSETVNMLDNSLKIAFKRVKVDIKIVKKESDPNIKYELFQRLNTLGTKLSDQEVRNCLLIMINKPFYKWLKGLADYDNFLNSVSLAERLIEEQYHMELALRYFIYKNIDVTKDIKGVYDLGEFITDKMIEFTNSQTFNQAQEEKNFKSTFDFINNTVGEDAFKRYSSTKNKFEGKFLLSAFESVAVGMGKNISRLETLPINDATTNDIKEKLKKLWMTKEFQERTGSGVSVSSRLPTIIPLGASLFKE